MLVAYNTTPHFMYGFNRHHPMHSPNPIPPYPSSLSQLDQSGVDFTGGWQEAQPHYGAGTVNSFANELKSPGPSNVFGPTSQSASSRGHYPSYSSSERSTVQPFQHDWTSPSLSPQSIHTPALTATNTPSQLYHNSFRQSVDIGHHQPSEWSQWRESTNADMIGLGTHSSASSWSSDPRAPPFSPQSIDDLLYSTSTATNSPTYSVTTDLPPIPSGHRISPFSSPSPSPSISSHKRSPKPSVSPPRTSDAPATTKQCSHCHATSTPLWRREPATLKTLCNACGLYLQQRHRHRPKELIEADLDDESDEDEDQNYNGPECSHCHTHRTSVWRRSKAGAQLCNACGVYARLRGKDRPLSLKRKKIKPRTKHASTSRST